MEAPVTPVVRIESILDEWRIRTLNSMTVVATIGALPALIATIAFWNGHHQWYGPVFFCGVYLLLAVGALARNLSYRTRGWILLFTTYAAATFALATTGLSGLGRVGLVLLPILAYILINPRTGWVATGFSIVIYLAVAILANEGLVNILIDSKAESVMAWAMSGATMVTLLLAAMVVIDRFYRLLLKALISQRRAAMELEQAYNSTLEGWARALELFDRETECHSRNVTQLTLELARTMGVSTSELIDIYRGALLHDIGKMGVPESVLMKPGELDETERAEMNKHPEYARQMLGPIEFLRQALDIPYCHHEKWDGSGYPRGLKGEEIPLSARIFSVVDVWEALTAKRPYHHPWPRDRALEFIREHAGSHFDPRVVDAFMNLAPG